MIQSFKEFLQEKWAIDHKIAQLSFPIYENPTSSDLVALKKTMTTGNSVRFIAVKQTQKVYVWEGMVFIHSIALKKLQDAHILPSNTSTQNLDQTLCGECELKQGRLTFINNDGMDTYFGDVIDVVVNNERFERGEEYFTCIPYDSPFDLIQNVDKILSDFGFIDRYIDEFKTHSSPALLKQAYKNYKFKKKI